MLNKQDLDNHIQGIYSPLAPFNQDDEILECNKCGFAAHFDKFDWDDDDLRCYCPECNDVVYEEE